MTVNVRSRVVWRTPILYRLFFPALGLCLLVGTVVPLGDPLDGKTTALVVVTGLLMTVGPFRPVVRLGERDVYARGVVLTRRMPLRDLAGVEGGYDGLAFVTVDGRHFTATGVGEKFNITRWLGRRGKADSISDTILAARERVLADVPQEQREDATGPAPEPSPVAAYTKVGRLLGGAVFLLGAYLAFVSDTLVAAGTPLMVAGTLAPVLLMIRAQKRGGSAAGRG